MHTNLVNHSLSQSGSTTEQATHIVMPGFPSNKKEATPFNPHELDIVRALLSEKFGFWIKDNWLEQLAAAIFRRMKYRSLTGFWDYLPLLKAEDCGEEVQNLLEGLLNHETSFGRTAPHFDALIKRVVPYWRSARSGRKWRIASLGCSTGEEAYSLAMSLGEVLTPAELDNVEITGMDVSHRVLAAARRGVYSEFQLRDLNPEQRSRWFTREANSCWKIHNTLRQHVRFYQHNLLSPLPFSGLDAIFCRNVLIYFKPPVVSKLLSEFNVALNRNGFLFLGHSESAFEHPELFEPVRTPHTIFYRRLSSPSPARN